MTDPPWDPPTESVTVPDQIDEGALDRLGLLEGERISRCWRSGTGFLVMTNLRCVLLWRRHEPLGPVEWKEGPNFFFYSLLPPRVLFGRFLELAQPGEGADSISRFLLRDPEGARREVEAARPGGRAEWERRRSLSIAAKNQRTAGGAGSGPTVLHEVVREVVKVRCRYCGNLMEVTSPMCPSCGASQ